eukprot:TRINITY_DN9884_c0_g1_i1.p1 TRINITY_DN9884_c0_g1~~TRINITY_DN9884_c0_g1_i1.p1  ORF type:complete len:608 (+),score=289.45 TRINITY_DN9884_c0_g1_i1:57-1880(+)
MRRYGRREVSGTTWEEESARGLDEVVGLLVDGGYHRARISALDAFDKVAGGLAWGIHCSRESINVDFIENANIGHKLKIGENIENALAAMRCPHDLQAHQIQGLDYPRIAAVVRWLLRRVRAVRQEQAVSLWRHAELCFERTFGALPGQQPEERTVAVPQRKYRRGADDDISTEQAHIASVLLEYGHMYQVRADMDVEAMVEDDDEGRAQEQLKRMLEEQEQELRALQEQMEAMPVCKERSKVSGQAVTGLVTQQSDAIARHAQAHDEKMAALRETDEESAALARRRAALERRHEELSKGQERLQAQQEQLAAARDAQAKAEKDVGKKERRLQRIRDELQRLRDELEQDPEKKAVFEALMALKQQADDLRDEEAALRRSCEAKMKEWKARLAEAQAEADAAAEQAADPERQSELEHAVSASSERLIPAQRLAAKRSREVTKIQRAIDEIPSRAELTQYERRFTELYEQVAWKFRETRENFNQYNVASDTRKYLEQERSLLKSVEEQMQSIMGPKEPAERKTALAESIKDIVEKVRAGQAKTGERLLGEKRRLEKLVAEYKELVAVQRRHLQGVKDMHEEFARGEHLRGKLEQFTAALQATEAADGDT